MARRVLILTMVLLSMTLAASAMAQSLGTGASEVQGSMNLTSVSYSGASLTTVGVDAFYGYFLTPNWEIAPGIDLTSVSGGGSTVTDFTGTGSVLYNFPAQGTVVPFVRGGLGFGTISGGGGSSINTTIIPLIGGGFRILLGNNASVNFTALYEHTSVSTDGASISGNAFLLGVGLSVFPVGFSGH
jgi:hypothetical protein